MTVKELRDALAGFDDDAPVVCQGTSVAVYPLRVEKLSDLLSIHEEDDHRVETWSFDHEDENAVVLVTEDPASLREESRRVESLRREHSRKQAEQEFGV